MGNENLQSTEKLNESTIRKSPNGIEGFNYVRNNYEQFAGLKITAENKRQFINAYKKDFVEANLEKVESGEITNEQLLEEAERYARQHVNFHKKMQKKHTKGHSYFTYKGRKERVVTQSVVTKLQQYLQDLEQKYIEEQSKQEEE